MQNRKFSDTFIQAALVLNNSASTVSTLSDAEQKQIECSKKAVKKALFSEPKNEKVNHQRHPVIHQPQVSRQRMFEGPRCVRSSMKDQTPSTPKNHR